MVLVFMEESTNVRVQRFFGRQMFSSTHLVASIFQNIFLSCSDKRVDRRERREVILYLENVVF